MDSDLEAFSRNPTHSNLDKIWKEFKTDKSKDKGIYKNDQYKSCTNCFGENLHTNYLDLICYDCGLVISSNYVTNCSSFETVPEAIPKKKYSNNYNKKISKMQDWYMWTNDEKNIYKLKTYVKNLCKDLKISEYLIEEIVNVVTMVMDTIKRNDGTKRARVKDGILVKTKAFISLPFDMQQLITRMLSKYREDRPQSVESIVSELLPMVEEQKTQVKVIPKEKKQTVEVIEHIKYQRVNWLTILCLVLLIMSIILNGLLLSEQDILIKEWLLEYYLKLFPG